RWLNIGPLSFQPSELLKIGSVIIAAAWFSHVKRKIVEFKYGLGPLLLLIGIASLVLLLQPDTDTLFIIVLALIAIYLVAGGRWSHVIALGLIGILIISLLAFTRPYLKQRIATFVNPASDPLGAGYQIQQSLIAVGSGRIFGRGPGQSIQKFNYLPEP